MEAGLAGKLHHFYGPVVSDLKAVEKRSVEWDLNQWMWDGDLFTATPMNSMQSDYKDREFFPVSNIQENYGASNSMSSGSEEAMLENEREKRDFDKKRRNVVGINETGLLNLQLGGFPITEGHAEGKSVKKTKFNSATPTNGPLCQVEDCKADLSDAKDYHRRHKVCNVHSKATGALVGNAMQRFCQQCSRFHVLQEFDEGKRSCRRRLAGHNKRRRKTHPDNQISATTLNNEHNSDYLLISLLKILSNIQSDNSDQTKHQDLLAHLLKNLGNVAGTTHQNITGMSPPVIQDLPNVPTRPTGSRAVLPSVRQNGSDFQFLAETSNTKTAYSSDDTARRTKMNNIDLNNVYDGSQDCMEDPQDIVALNTGNSSPAGLLWLSKDSQMSSPPQSGNSGSTSSRSPSTSSGEAQSRTDRIVFKLFGKDPSDFPFVLRKQILDWLSNSPTEIESYIRPGCVILTIYLRMDESTWEELYCNLTSNLGRLLDSSADPFWKNGWIFTRVLNHVTFMYNGQVFLDTPVPLNKHRCCRIISIKPIAVSVSEGVQFVVKGYDLSHPTSRLLCALEGNYLVQEDCADMVGGSDSFVEDNGIQSLSFSCVVPNVIGRGFIEVENHGLSSSFFPFIVAEKDVCAEICSLESIIEAPEVSNASNKNHEVKKQALDYVNEIGWLLHRSHLRVRLGEASGDVDRFSFKRFRWLIEFSIDHDWSAVVNKLLRILFDGNVDLGHHESISLALLDACLLHRAVRRNCRSMVEFLLKYQASDAKGPGHKHFDEAYYLFRPDDVGPGGLTPLHIAASLDGAENILDALTDDPGQVAIEAWKKSRDDTGLTPQDYACFRGHYTYIHLVQKKVNQKSGRNKHIILNIPGIVQDNGIKQTIQNPNKDAKFAVFQTELNFLRNCRQCKQKMVYGSSRASLKIYRPAMLAMVTIAAVCVCAALLFKSSPEVLCSLKPFRWELLDYGSQ